MAQNVLTSTMLQISTVISANVRQHPARLRYATPPGAEEWDRLGPVGSPESMIM
jgi:hypothetical protein